MISSDRPNHLQAVSTTAPGTQTSTHHVMCQFNLPPCGKNNAHTTSRTATNPKLVILNLEKHIFWLTEGFIYGFTRFSFFLSKRNNFECKYILNTLRNISYALSRFSLLYNISQFGFTSSFSCSVHCLLCPRSAMIGRCGLFLCFMFQRSLVRLDVALLQHSEYNQHLLGYPDLPSRSTLLTKSQGYLAFGWNFWMNLKSAITFTGELNVTFSKLLSGPVQQFSVSVLSAQLAVL